MNKYRIVKLHRTDRTCSYVVEEWVSVLFGLGFWHRLPPRLATYHDTLEGAKLQVEGLYYASQEDVVVEQFVTNTLTENPGP